MVAQLTIEDTQVITKAVAEITVQPYLYTVEEFMQLDLPDDNRYELSEGEIVDMGTTGYRHGEVQRKLERVFILFLEQNKLGKTYSNTGFRLAEKTVRAPDVAFLPLSKLPPVIDGAIPLPPDLAIEVISPTDDWSQIIKKIREYQEAKVPLIWLVDPYMPCVFLFHQTDTYPTILKLEDDLDGEDVVPGFKLNVKDLFEF